MTIYIDEHGQWGGGDADELTFIDDGLWTESDYYELSKWHDGKVLDYARTHSGMTPTEWARKKATP